MINNNNMDIVNVDNQGNVIPEAFPVSNRTRNDHRKTSVGYTLIAVLLHILAFVPIIAVSVVLAARCYELMPYYSFWPFVGVIVVGVFGLIFLAVSLIVTRKKSKSSIMGQTAKIAITFTCLTSVFALILTYIVPDIISMATQNTLFVEDLYYNGESQAEKNAKLERDFIMYNVLNGNLNNYNVEDGDYSYKTLSKREESPMGIFLSYDNEEIQNSYDMYRSLYNSVDSFNKNVLDVMKTRMPHKYEMYEFVYSTYVLNDYDYALVNTMDRRWFAISIVDYIYAHSDYEQLLKEGFNNKKIKQLFDDNFDSFNHDGYQPFDDPLLLYAQVNGRMTVPVVLRLILNEGWTFTQGAYDDNGNVYFTEDGNMLYELYDPATRDAFVKDGGSFTFKDTRINGDGTVINDDYGFNKDGWMVYESGVVKRPINWLVLDMLGDPMDVANIEINSALAGVLGGMLPGGGSLPPEMVGSALAGLLQGLGGLVDSVGELIQGDVGELIQFATGGANLTLSLCIDDNGALNVSITPMNATYGILGYMQASWVQSNNLLMAVINVIGIRNWLCIFGAVGLVLVIAAGICREMGRKTRLRTAVSRDRIARANTAQKIADGELDPSETNQAFDLGAEITAARVVEIEQKQQNNKKLAKQADELENEMFDAPVTTQPVAEDNGFDELAEESVKEKKSIFGRKKKVEESIDDLATDTDTEPAIDNVGFNEIAEEPVKEKRGLFGRKKKEETFDELVEEPVSEPIADNFNEFTEEESVKEKKSLFGRKKKEKSEEFVDDFAVDTFNEPVVTATNDVATDNFDELGEEPVKEKKGLFGKKKKEKSEDFTSDFDSDGFDEVAEAPAKEKKGLFGKKKKSDDVENATEDLAASDEVVDEPTFDELAEEPVKEKKGLFGKKKKDKENDFSDDSASELSADNFDEIADEPIKEKKSKFGKKKKKEEETVDGDEDFIF